MGPELSSAGARSLPGGTSPLWMRAGILLLVTVQSLGFAQETGDAVSSMGALKSVKMVRIDSPPVIDGVMDDEVWSKAAVIDDFHQSKPIEGAEPSERSEIYLLYDDDAIYIGGRFYDSQPERISASILRHRVSRLGDDDRLAVVLSPYNDRRSGYRFEINPNGVKHDSIYQNVSQTLPDWNTIWDTASSINDEGWVTEIAIPFKSISFDANSDTWGINFSRAVRRKGEEISWISRNRSYNPSIVGLATGIEGLNQGVGLDIVPAISFNQRRTFDTSESESDVHPSIDLFYKLTPSLNAALTINTDFSGTAVDQRQVNLTRFSLFFPEQRAFFLQDTDIFEFGRIGGRGNDVNQATSRSGRENGRPFFSRRLGLSATGQPVDLNYGGKLSGRIGSWSVGALIVQQDDFNDIESTDTVTLRATRSIFDESAIGVIFTAGDPTSNLDNSLIGMDFRYLNSQLAGVRTVEADAWFQQSTTDNLDGNDQAFGVGLRAPNQSGWRWGVALKEIQENFYPALGYVNRSDIREQTADVGYTHFMRSGPVVSLFMGIDAQRIESTDGDLQTQVVALRPLEMENRSRDKVEVRYFSTDDVLTKPFTIYRDPSDPTQEIIIPIGSYSFDEYRIEIESGSQRSLAGSLTYQAGDFYDGKRVNIGGEVTWRPSKHFSLNIGYDWNDIELPQGDFVTQLVSSTIEIPFSTKWAWANLVQYDNVSETVGINSRLQWIQQDGREVIAVLNHNMQDRDRDNTFESTISELSLKLNYTFRF